MAHVDDLTLVNSAQMAAADNIYLAKLGDADPDRRAALSELAEYLGGSSDLITALKTALPIEAGSWTPILSSNGTNPSVTYSIRYGNYLRIGDLWVFDCYIATSARTGGTGNLRVTGLPFTFPRTVPLGIRTNGITYSNTAIGRGIAGGAAMCVDNVGGGLAPSELPISSWPPNAAMHLSGAISVAP